MERSGQGEEAQGKERRAQGKPPALLFLICLIEHLSALLISLVSPTLEPDCQSLSGHSQVSQALFSFRGISVSSS